MAHEWYYSREGRKVGPISSASLKHLADTEQLALTDLVWRKGLAAWVPASQVKGLFVTLPELPNTLNEEVKEQASGQPTHAGFVLATTTPTQDATRQSLAACSKITVMGIHGQRIALAVAALLGGASAVLPWSVDNDKVSYAWQIGGWWLHLLFAVPLVVAWLGDWSKAIKGMVRIPAAMAATLAALITTTLMLETNIFIFQVKAEGKDNLFVSTSLLINETERLLTPGTPVLAVKDAVAKLTNRHTGSGAYVLLLAAISCVFTISILSKLSRQSPQVGGAVSHHE